MGGVGPEGGREGWAPVPPYSCVWPHNHQEPAHTSQCLPQSHWGHFHRGAIVALVQEARGQWELEISSPHWTGGHTEEKDRGCPTSGPDPHPPGNLSITQVLRHLARRKGCHGHYCPRKIQPLKIKHWASSCECGYQALLSRICSPQDEMMSSRGQTCGKLWAQNPQLLLQPGTPKCHFLGGDYLGHFQLGHMPSPRLLQSLAPLPYRTNHPVSEEAVPEALNLN